MIAALLQIIAADNIDLYVSNALFCLNEGPMKLTSLHLIVQLARPVLSGSKTASSPITLWSRLRGDRIWLLSAPLTGKP